MTTRITPTSMDEALQHLARRDRKLARLIRDYPRCELDTGRRPLFSALASSIIGQQLSTTAAATIRNRVRKLSGGALRPEAMAALSVEDLRAAGLSAAKTRYVLGLAEAATCGELNFRSLARQDDAAVIEALTAHAGVGEWTAQMFLMFGLQRPDIAAPGDLGLQRGLQMLHDLEERPQGDEFLALVEPWRPFRSVGCWYLWRLAG